jgi:hypothetical protein
LDTFPPPDVVVLVLGGVWREEEEVIQIKKDFQLNNRF